MKELNKFIQECEEYISEGKIFKRFLKFLSLAQDSSNKGKTQIRDSNYDGHNTSKEVMPYSHKRRYIQQAISHAPSNVKIFYDYDDNIPSFPYVIYFQWGKNKQVSFHSPSPFKNVRRAKKGEGWTGKLGMSQNIIDDAEKKHNFQIQGKNEF